MKWNQPKLKINDMFILDILSRFGGVLDHKLRKISRKPSKKQVFINDLDEILYQKSILSTTLSHSDTKYMHA